jgi:3-dehydroquinate dehydratase type I
MIKLGDLALEAGKPAVAVSFTDADGKDEVAEAKACGVALAELRIDLFARLTPDYVEAQARRLAGLPTLATIRDAREGGDWTGSDEDRLALYRTLLPLVDGVDVELSSAGVLAALVPEARAQGKVVVVSHHDFTHTPSLEQLKDIAARAVEAGADVVKIAARTDTAGDVEILSQLLADRPATHMVVIGMGDHGAPTRLLFPGQGSLFTFAAKGERSTAPGQLDYKKTLKLLSGLYPGT